ncbi:Possible purine/pyrimidine phosphoribosyltransferase [hydrothermal vent metagenome]|uniref:Possible purine/pyrimidine phosphoribosyltransferase n=1 Tax=hydrothermal vent metagenome TaxID=652676 RepID=A0A1W1CFR5_9ZZZZ
MQTLFSPHTQTRTLGTLDVISFYHYTTLESLLLTKHKPEGYRIYKMLAQELFLPFAKEYSENTDSKVYVVGIDEYVGSGYSHVSLLTRAMKTKNIIPLHSSLMAQNRINYSGRDLAFRLENPRDFSYTGEKNIDVILVDDIITTGITLQEAQKVLIQNGVNVLFALTLANVEND